MGRLTPFLSKVCRLVLSRLKSSKMNRPNTWFLVISSSITSIRTISSPSVIRKRRVVVISSHAIDDVANAAAAGGEEGATRRSSGIAPAAAPSHHSRHRFRIAGGEAAVVADGAVPRHRVRHHPGARVRRAHAHHRRIGRARRRPRSSGAAEAGRGGGRGLQDAVGGRGGGGVAPVLHEVPAALFFYLPREAGEEPFHLPVEFLLLRARAGGERRRHRATGASRHSSRHAQAELIHAGGTSRQRIPLAGKGRLAMIS
mmetsp:Transcript_34193/g.72852  ORF Transcript_34193/g.72852 Transcript_34193/m.72852 type:complete len:257 (-) Transcript_34193:417-1187(-)